MTTLPTWAVYAVSLGTPIFTFLGVLLAQFIARIGAREMEARSRREEVMRNLRWAAELAVSEADGMADLGVAQLTALLESDLLDESEKVFVEAALDPVYEGPEAELDGLGEGADVVQYVKEVNAIDDESARPDGEGGAVPSGPDPENGGEGSG